MSKLIAFIIVVIIGGMALSLVLLFRLIKKKVSLKRAFLLLFLYGALSIVVLYPYRLRIGGYFNRFQTEITLRNKPNSNCDCVSLEVQKDDYARLHRPLAIRLTNNGFIKNEATLNDFLRRKRLVSIGDGDGYYIQNLSSSSKHLTPIAKKRLEELAILFRSFLKDSQNEKDYFVVSSITRTEKQQEEICQKYPNACTRGKSTHSFGVSFDINRIKSFGDCAVSLQAFIKALNKMRDEKKIVLCPENRCIHVTVIK